MTELYNNHFRGIDVFSTISRTNKHMQRMLTLNPKDFSWCCFTNHLNKNIANRNWIMSLNVRNFKKTNHKQTTTFRYSILPTIHPIVIYDRKYRHLLQILGPKTVQGSISICLSRLGGGLIYWIMSPNWISSPNFQRSKETNRLKPPPANTYQLVFQPL